MNIIGKTLTRTSKRTGRVIKNRLLLSSDFDTPLDYQIFLIEIYQSDIAYYKEYSDILYQYIQLENNNLTLEEIIENQTILSTIQAMHIVRDKKQYDEEIKSLNEYQQFIHSLLLKSKK